MLFIKDFLQHLFPERSDISELSVLCLTTSNPVYLIFNADSATPEFAIRLSKSENFLDSYRTHQKLYEQLGDMIAKPLHIKKVENQFFFVEAGLNGIPWYQLADRFSANDEWLNIKRLAISRLNTFQEAIKQAPDWCLQIELGNSLRKQYEECSAFNIALPKAIENLVNQYSFQLDKLAPINTFFQHGDFSLNNLLFHENSSYIIDFEDFGMTCLPLHDEFSLALSFCAAGQANQNTLIKPEIHLCLSRSSWTKVLPTDVFPALFLHHLLLRLGKWGHAKERSEHCNWLLEILESFTADPTALFDKK